MDEKLLIKLLQLHYEHGRKLHELAGKINLNYLEVDLLDVVLDAIGVPADNTLAQIRKYGYAGWLDQPDTCSREWYYDEFQRQVKHGSTEEFKAYLDDVTITGTFYHLLSGGRPAMALIEF